MSEQANRSFRHAHDRDASIRGILTMLGEVTPHHVVAYQTHDEACTAAHLCELSVVALRARGCAGAVIDGGCRDVEELRMVEARRCGAQARRR
jgi:regulator of RNase E activity RraA